MDYFFSLPDWTQFSLLSLFIISILLMFLLLWLNTKHSAQTKILHEAEKNIGMAELQLQQLHEKIEEQQIFNNSMQDNFSSEKQKLLEKIENFQHSESNYHRKIGELEQRVVNAGEITRENHQLRDKYEIELARNTQLVEQKSALVAELEKERQHMSEKLSILETAEKRLAIEFENIANKIFEQKSEKFTKTSESGLNQILSPLKSQLDDFKKQVNEHYVTEGKERASLRTEITSLKALNQRITEEAAALTHALKGDSKKQGNWGEIVLERLLEESGLRKGYEYELQVSKTNEHGKRFYPDVVVHLPNKKDVVIDSKVSLTAYERQVNAEDEQDAKQALKQHVMSIKSHIKDLSRKDYQDLEGLRTLDYVLMFVPIEAAFIAAVEEEPDLIKLALENQIMMVSPTNLLVALRTIHNIWQYEYQHENAAKIAENAKKIYDKFVGFLQDMEKIGKQIDTAALTHEAAMNKLQSGRGNIIRQLENFKTLGVSPTKAIDSKYIGEDD